MNSYIIGSFNILQFNLNKDFDILAKIIKEEGFDIVAIQEAHAKNAVKELVCKLNPRDWDYRCPEGNEEYAFVWRKNKLRLSELPKERQNPNIMSGYKYDTNRGEIQLVRPPYVGYFTSQGMPGGCNFDLRLINTHITFTKPQNAPLSVGEPNARRNELMILSRDIYGTVSDRVLGSKRSIFTLLLGDYNLVIEGDGPKIITPKLLEDGYDYKIKNGKQMYFDQREKTTLRLPKDEDVTGRKAENKAELKDQKVYIEGSTDYYSSNYDHFGYESTLPEKYQIKCSRVDALKYINDSDGLRTYRKIISDHVPIKLEIKLI